MTIEQQTKWTKFNHHFTAVKSSATDEGMYDVVVFNLRPSIGPVLGLTLPARDLRDFEKTVRQAATEHRLEKAKERELALQSAERDIEKFAIELFRASKDNREQPWHKVDGEIRDVYLGQARRLYAEGWRKSGQRL